VAFFALLDACVLYPASLRDTLLRFASADFYVPMCSQRILDEAERNLVADGVMSADDARRLRAKMTAVFADGLIADDAIVHLETTMTNDPKDRHVLAAAVASETQTIVTHNVTDFPARALAPWDVQAQHPDEFLLGLFNIHPDLAAAMIVRQAQALRSPPLTPRDVLAALDVAGAPRFAEAVASRLRTSNA
jgi:predicted nucleic acid-binding protein